MLRLAVSSSKGKRTILGFLRVLKSQTKLAPKMDTTEYLMSSPTDREGLLKAMDDFENNRDVFIQRNLIEL
ncbi:hypothetical protein [Dyadobacter alkalitolerans]|uniref:hypothetical protein n=1 Tax=Dyadobacter alkalitolerans TaxID=492736 RepID=UPI00047C0173|nr:hypothetical protein [Dyadobacter alkalitolerans]